MASACEEARGRYLVVAAAVRGSRGQTGSPIEAEGAKQWHLPGETVIGCS